MIDVFREGSQSHHLFSFLQHVVDVFGEGSESPHLFSSLRGLFSSLFFEDGAMASQVDHKWKQEHERIKRRECTHAQLVSGKCHSWTRAARRTDGQRTRISGCAQGNKRIAKATCLGGNQNSSKKEARHVSRLRRSWRRLLSCLLLSSTRGRCFSLVVYVLTASWSSLV